MSIMNIIIGIPKENPATISIMYQSIVKSVFGLNGHLSTSLVQTGGDPYIKS